MNSDRFDCGYYESAYNRTVRDKIEGVVDAASSYTSEELGDIAKTIQQQRQTSQIHQTPQLKNPISKKF